MAITTGTSVSVMSGPVVPGQRSPVAPVLQAQDGSFVGTVWTTDRSQYMVAFDATGNVRWSVPGYCPQTATDDGGVIATPGSYCDPAGSSGAAVTFDQNGSATGQMGKLPTYSWVGNAYQRGSVLEWLSKALNVAKSWWPFAGGNPSGNNAATQQPWYAPLKSCPGASTPCPQEAILDGLRALRNLLQAPCSACNTWVFSKLTGTDQASFFRYLSLRPRFWDGTRSYAPAQTAFCPSGWLNQHVLCTFGIEKVHDYMQRTGDDAVSQTPSDDGRGMQLFFNPASGICNAFSSANPPSNDQGTLNQATLFHEALHGYTGRFDSELQSAFGLGFGGSVNITYYLQGKVIPGGAQGAAQCTN